MNQKVLADLIYDWNFTDQVFTKKHVGILRKQLLTNLKDESKYLSYEVENGKIIKLVYAEFNNAPFELDRIQINCFYFDDKVLTKKLVKDELEKLKKYFHPKKLKTSILFPVREGKLKKILISLGFVDNGVKLKGKVLDSLRVLKKITPKKLPEGFKIRVMNHEKDIDDVLKVELRSHRADPTSVVHKLPKKHWSFFNTFLKDLSKKRTSFVLTYNDKVAGIVAFNKAPHLAGDAMIATISLDNKYKGMGLSKHLYLHAINDMHKRKIKYYYGYSKTRAVLGFAKKLKRKLILESLTRKKS